MCKGISLDSRWQLNGHVMENGDVINKYILNRLDNHAIVLLCANQLQKSWRTSMIFWLAESHKLQILCALHIYFIFFNIYSADDALYFCLWRVRDHELMRGPTLTKHTINKFLLYSTVLQLILILSMLLISKSIDLWKIGISSLRTIDKLSFPSSLIFIFLL